MIRGPDGVPIPQNGSIAYGLQVARQDNQLRYEARLREMEAAEVRKQEREREEREKERKQKDQVTIASFVVVQGWIRGRQAKLSGARSWLYRCRISQAFQA